VRNFLQGRHTEVYGEPQPADNEDKCYDCGVPLFAGGGNPPVCKMCGHSFCVNCIHLASRTCPKCIRGDETDSSGSWDIVNGARFDLLGHSRVAEQHKVTEGNLLMMVAGSFVLFAVPTDASESRPCKGRSPPGGGRAPELPRSVYDKLPEAEQLGRNGPVAAKAVSRGGSREGARVPAARHEGARQGGGEGGARRKGMTSGRSEAFLERRPPPAGVANQPDGSCLRLLATAPLPP